MGNEQDGVSGRDAEESHEADQGAQREACAGQGDGDHASDQSARRGSEDQADGASAAEGQQQQDHDADYGDRRVEQQ
ncbi:hypothetical protein LTR94_037733, partial [Friedmanniomyces endolithicus]